MRPILIAVLTAALAVPSTALACGMPMRVAEVKSVTLADAIDAIDDEGDKNVTVSEADKIEAKAAPKAKAADERAEPPAPPNS